MVPDMDKVAEPAQLNARQLEQARRHAATRMAKLMAKMERPDRRGPPRPRTQPNALRDWLEAVPPPMTKIEFAKRIGVSASLVSMLIADNAPWPSREVVRRIGVVTRGAVTPNDLAGYPPAS